MAFEKHRVRYLVVGGYAVSVYTRPRFTKDLDLWLDWTPANLNRAYRALLAFGAPAFIAEAVRHLTMSETVWMGRIPLRVDFMTALPGLRFAEAWSRRQRKSIHGVKAFFLDRQSLIFNKRLVGRPQDRLDVAALERKRRR
jgi:hypothetical protein